MGMYQVRNNRRLTGELIAHVCARPAIVIDLCDAAASIDMHGDRTPPWVAAQTAIKCADRNPPDRRATLEDALPREGMPD
jgi:hypothetical protein